MTRRRTGRLASAVLAALVALPAAAQQLESVLDRQARAQQAAAESQRRIDGLADETEALVQEYREVLRRVSSLRVYNEQLERLIESQQAEMASKRQQIDDVTVISRDIRPLLGRMIEALEQFVALDVPFLLDERRERIAFLRSLLERADVSDAERYRRVLEAYQIESDYGRNIEAYEGSLEVDGTSRQVHFLSIGRVALFYQTLDGSRAGRWDRELRAWQPLDDDFGPALRRAFRVAREQRAPDLLTLPISAPVEAKP